MVRSIRSWVIEMNLDLTKLINHKAVVPGLLGMSVFSAGVAAGVILERVLGKPKPSNYISAEVDDHPQLFDPDDPPKNDRLVITLEDAIAMSKEADEEPKFWSDVEPAVDGDGEPIKFVDRVMEAHSTHLERKRLDEETEAAEYYEPPDHIPEALLDKVASAGTPVPFNVLDAATPDEVEEWDWDKEVLYREANPQGPYAIHEDEYASGSANFHIQEMLYYAVDQIVCEQLDPRSMMYDHALKLGDVKFGYGTHDVDVAFVRNPLYRTDYQITQMHDSYTESVMGIVADEEADDAELAHMDRPLRMRRID